MENVKMSYQGRGSGQRQGKEASYVAGKESKEASGRDRGGDSGVGRNNAEGGEVERSNDVGGGNSGGVRSQRRRRNEILQTEKEKNGDEKEANPAPTNDPIVAAKLLIDMKRANKVPSIPSGSKRKKKEEEKD
ncbi:hypothetical protein PIB30_036878 [Stylosanthes scabra]|uniref:Uncharacterized protein n=1 Tax=Stylosanthes scabra TaxID=79078 RepID=A0ABU6XBL6_9FABA|nr:hypothetical protein [Stylosanthes scabra]